MEDHQVALVERGRPDSYDDAGRSRLRPSAGGLAEHDSAANSAVDVLTEGAAEELLTPPVNVLRLALHPKGMAPRVVNLADWGRHIVESLRAQALKSPDPRLDEFIAELEGYVPDTAPGPDFLGFAVPLRLRCEGGELQLLTTLTSFSTALDVTLSELHLEAFLPADEATAEILRARRT